VRDWYSECTITHDFKEHAGQIFQPNGELCDMAACIQLFNRIDPHVSSIRTFHGCDPATAEKDTVYRKKKGKWEALL